MCPVSWFWQSWWLLYKYGIDRHLGKATVPLSCKLTNVCEWLVSLAISQASAKREYERVHVRDALPTCESKLTSAKLENTCEYSQMNTWVLEIILTSTHNRTREYSQSNSPVLASSRNRTRKYLQSFAWVGIFVGVSRNGINKLWYTCGMAIRGKLVPGDVLSCFVARDTVCERFGPGQNVGEGEQPGPREGREEEHLGTLLDRAKRTLYASLIIA